MKPICANSWSHAPWFGSLSTASATPSKAYDTLVKSGNLVLDAKQAAITRRFLDKLHSRLDGYALPVFQPPSEKKTTEEGGKIGGEPEEQKIMVPRGLYVHGGTLDVRGSTKSGVCRTSFSLLCNTEKGAADYKALAECFHTLVLDDVPALSMAQDDQARRFILLVDELYEHRTRLVLSSEVAEPREIFQVVDEIVRTASEGANSSSAIEEEKQRVNKENAAVGVPTRCTCWRVRPSTNGRFGYWQSSCTERSEGSFQTCSRGYVKGKVTDTLRKISVIVLTALCVSNPLFKTSRTYNIRIENVSCSLPN